MMRQENEVKQLNEKLKSIRIELSNRQNVFPYIVFLLDIIERDLDFIAKYIDRHKNIADNDKRWSIAIDSRLALIHDELRNILVEERAFGIVNDKSVLKNWDKNENKKFQYVNFVLLGMPTIIGLYIISLIFSGPTNIQPSNSLVYDSLVVLTGNQKDSISVLNSELSKLNWVLENDNKKKQPKYDFNPTINLENPTVSPKTNKEDDIRDIWTSRFYKIKGVDTLSPKVIKELQGIFNDLIVFKYKLGAIKTSDIDNIQKRLNVVEEDLLNEDILIRYIHRIQNKPNSREKFYPEEDLLIEKYEEIFVFNDIVELLNRLFNLNLKGGVSRLGKD